MNWNLNRMLDAEFINMNKITEEIEFNPFLATKVLQIANSVSYGLKKEIVSIRSAVILIGLRQLKALVISFELLNAFSNIVDKRFEKTVNQFWHESLKKAIIAKRIAEAWGSKVDKESYFYIRIALEHRLPNLALHITRRFQRIPNAFKAKADVDC